MIELKYRADVDGLRAVAVVLVLLYHGGLGFSGGYIGVDVFFVISGFLITGLILKQQDAGHFSLANFWQRRIRRIVPAVTVMVTTVLVVGFFLLFPNDFDELGKSTIAQQMLLSNVFFLHNTGYFASPADLKPLLHTWSLAVEEQFYLGYPLLLIFLHRWGRRTTCAVLGLLGLGSLMLSQYGVKLYPSATFFLLPTRAWELLLGGLICFLPKPTRISPRALAAASWLSLGAIFIAGWCYASTTDFPGLAALVPCVATALLIYCNSLRLSFPAVVLGSKPFVFVGLISYSLYLWHWPILAYARCVLGPKLGEQAIVSLLALSFAVAALSWRFVEWPLRQYRANRIRRAGFAGICVLSAASLIGSWLVVRDKGMPARLPLDAVRLASAASSQSFKYNVTPEEAQRGELPCFGAPLATRTCLLWGDSHAMAIAPGLDAACKSMDFRGFQATYWSTAPLLDFGQNWPYGLKEKMPVFNRAVLDFVRANKLDVAFLAGVWSKYAEEHSFERQLKHTIQELTACGTHVVVVLDVAWQNVDVPRYLSRSAMFQTGLNYCGVTMGAYRSKNGQCNKIIRRVSSQENAAVLDPSRVFVDSSGIWRILISGEVMYRDEHHLTIEGGLRLKGIFESFLDSLQK